MKQYLKIIYTYYKYVKTIEEKYGLNEGKGRWNKKIMGSYKDEKNSD